MARPRCCCYVGYRSKTHLKLSFRKILFPHNWFLCCRIVFKKFSQSTAVMLPCSVQNVKTMRQLTWMSWKDLSLVSDRSHIASAPCVHNSWDVFYIDGRCKLIHVELYFYNRQHLSKWLPWSQHLENWTRWLPFCRGHFQIHFLTKVLTQILLLVLLILISQLWFR